jgi:putative ABC transport system substrate-binding protein
VGLVASLAHPGGNVTGFTDQAVELSAKRLEMLREVVPTARRVAVLWNEKDAAMTLRYQQIDKAGRLLGIAIEPFGVRSSVDFAAGFSAMDRDPPDALLMVSDTLTTSNRSGVLAFSQSHRVPVMFEDATLVREGGLMAYGASQDDAYRSVAGYVDRIFKGANPRDLPVEQPERYYLTVNRKAARGLGLAIPRSILIRADEVIE